MAAAILDANLGEAEQWALADALREAELAASGTQAERDAATELRLRELRESGRRTKQEAEAYRNRHNVVRERDERGGGLRVHRVFTAEPVAREAVGDDIPDFLTASDEACRIARSASPAAKRMLREVLHSKRAVFGKSPVEGAAGVPPIRIQTRPGDPKMVGRGQSLI